MPVFSYVQMRRFSAAPGNDIRVEVHQAVKAGKFEIEDPVGLIADDVFASLEDFIDLRYDVAQIRKLMENDGKYRLRVFDQGSKSRIKGIYLTVDKAHNMIYYDIRGRMVSRQLYTVQHINDADVGYLVSEHIVGPMPGVGLIERCCRPYFRDMVSALKYRESKMRSYDPGKGSAESGWRVLVVDCTQMEKSRWYQGNLRAGMYIKNYHLNAEEYRYIGDPQELLDAVKLAAYDDLSEDEKAAINYSIYTSMRPFISDDVLESMDEDADLIEQSEMEALADSAIIIAFAGADTVETFQAIYAALGKAEYRVGALTDDIYNAHPDEGYILVSSDGEMNWYEDAEFMDSWPGNANNPWFGKFQRNENDTLLCFREFHPELIVQRLPTRAECVELENRYFEDMSVRRSVHDEMTFDMWEDDYGRPAEVCEGTWYNNGLRSRHFVEGTHFPRVYGSHTFSEDECRRLLNGEEIEIKQFRTKSDRVVDIRGKLKDCASMYEDEPRIEFSRTDINAANRRKMAIDFGIEANEPGLPGEEDI